MEWPPEAPATHEGMSRTDMVVIWLLTGIVAISAALMSFATLRDLALGAGFSPSLAWLFPLTIDLGALFSSLVWMTGDHDERARRFGKWMTRVLLLLSVVGNAVQHAVTSTADQWPRVAMVVLVSAVPPAVFGALVHLSTLAREKPADPDAAVDDEDHEPIATPVEIVEEVAEAVGLPFVPLTPRQTTCHVYRFFDASDELLYVGVANDVTARCRTHKRKKAWWSEVVHASIVTYPTRRDALREEQSAIAEEEPRYNIMPGGETDHATPQSDPDWTPSDPIETRENIPAVEMHAPVRGEGAEDDQTLADRVVLWAMEEGSMPSRERVRLRFNIGSKRAERIRGIAVELQESTRSDPGPDSADVALTEEASA